MKTTEIQITKILKYKFPKYRFTNYISAEKIQKKIQNTEMQLKKSYLKVQVVPSGPRGT